eukprot:3635044-Rhodomonas_salina.2
MLFKVAPMLSFAGHPAPAATMLYDPAKDPLWPEIKVSCLLGSRVKGEESAVLRFQCRKEVVQS